MLIANVNNTYEYVVNITFAMEICHRNNLFF